MTGRERDPVDAPSMQANYERVRSAMQPFVSARSDAWVALDALVARVQELEANGRHLSNLLDWREREKAALAVRVEAAEARVQELDAALRDAEAECNADLVIPCDCDDDGAVCLAHRVLAALRAEGATDA